MWPHQKLKYATAAVDYNEIYNNLKKKEALNHKAKLLVVCCNRFKEFCNDATPVRVPSRLATGKTFDDSKCF